MDARIGLDRPSMRTNVLIHARPDVGRARETLIYAPARVRASDVVFGRPAAARTRETPRETRSDGPSARPRRSIRAVRARWI